MARNTESAFVCESDSHKVCSYQVNDDLSRRRAVAKSDSEIKGGVILSLMFWANKQASDECAKAKGASQ